MFSGVIRHLGVVVKPLFGKTEGEIVVRSSELSSVVEVGGSVAVNGVCLTVTEVNQGNITFFAGYETVKRSTLSMIKPNTVVNLELPVTPSTLLNGHIVLGHVDTVGEVKEIINVGSSHKFVISVPREFMGNLVLKGSVAVDGISLTVCEIDETLNLFSVSVVPYSYQNTNLKYLRPCDYVNVEFDIFGKYVERFLLASENSRLTVEKLKNFLEE